jgi:hypothetical protein
VWQTGHSNDRMSWSLVMAAVAVSLRSTLQAEHIGSVMALSIRFEARDRISVRQRCG